MLDCSTATVKVPLLPLGCADFQLVVFDSVCVRPKVLLLVVPCMPAKEAVPEVLIKWLRNLANVGLVPLDRLHTNANGALVKSQ